MARDASKPSESPNAEATGPAPPDGTADSPAPSGLVVVIEAKPRNDRSFNLQALDNPFISGVALQIHWADLEPVEGKPDWSKLDQLFSTAEKSRKWVQLLVFPGFFSPAWALEGVKTERFPIQYGPENGTVLELPMPWDGVYLGRWFAFLGRLGARYGNSSVFKMIGAAGPTSVSVEMTLPQKPKEMKTWQHDSYTPGRYQDAWQKAFQAYAADFSNQYVSLSLGNGLDIDERGEIAPGEGVRTRQAIIDQAMRLLGRRFVLQNSDLTAGPVQHGATTFVMGYSGRAVTGLQLRTSAKRDSAGMGAPGDPPLALRKSIDKGAELNSAGQRVNYLEIYEPDVLADEMQPVLRYGASLLGVGNLPAPHAAGGSITSGPTPLGSEGRNTEPNLGEGTSGEPRMPTGLSVVNRIDPHRVGRPFDTSNATLNAYTNPNTSGVTFRTSWADVEPEEGKFDFSKLDTVFANAEKNGRWVDLILIPGFGSPGWALQGAQSGMFSIPYGAGSGKVLPLPVPWDQTYLSRWFTFLKAIADRYGGRTSFRMIAAAGPTSVSSEMSLPDSADDLIQWKKFGYTSQKYIDAWKQTFAAYASTFPHQYFSLSLHAALPIPNRSQGPYAREQIVNLGLRYPSQFALESDGLNSSRSDTTLGLVRDHSGQVATGFMMSTAATDRSERMGAEDDPALALRKSIDRGMEANSAGQHVNYLEIYEPDVLVDEMQPVLSYAASLLGQKQPASGAP